MKLIQEKCCSFVEGTGQFEKFTPITFPAVTNAYKSRP